MTVFSSNFFSYKNLQRCYQLLCISFLSISVTLICASGVFAQTRGGEILQESLDATAISTEAMNNMWENLFVNESLLYNQIVNLATVLMMVGAFFLVLAFARAMQAADKDKLIEIIGWGFVVIILLANRGEILKHVTIGSREFINDQAKNVLLAQVGDLTVKDALQDVLLTEKIQENVRAVFSGCEAKEGDAQLECIEEGVEEAKKIVADYEAKFTFPGLTRLKRNLEVIAGEVLNKRADRELTSREAFAEWDRRTSALIWQSATSSASKTFLKNFQNWFTYGYEFAMLLTGIIGPLSVSASLIPKSPRAFVSWAIGFFSIGVLKLSYNIVIGFAALYASSAEMEDLGSSGFLLMMSIGAPLISIAIAGGGGAAIFFALGKTTAIVATIIPAAGSAASGIGGGGR